MISSYCRPSNLPPEVPDRSPDPPAERGEPDHASPRSCAELFLGAAAADRDREGADRAANHGKLNMMEGAPKIAISREETPVEVAMLLAAVADIAAQEIRADPPTASALADVFPRFPDLGSTLSDEDDRCRDGIAIAPQAQAQAARCEYEAVDSMDCEVGDAQMEAEEAPALMHFDHRKRRAVSVDYLAPPPSPPHEREAIPTLLQWRNLRGETTSPPQQQQQQQGIFSTPPPSPLTAKRGRHAVQHGRRQARPRAVSMAEGGAVERIPVLDMAPAPERGVDDKPKKLILRKKFSWKNYPQLEEFLIANREEYLRHSTLNYTMQQKKYNNCLTQRMIELASEHGHAFDETEFSFVAVRDRIRCYYKSYVQSMKKRGVVIGYAARRAGLVTESELERSAHTNGKIYVPRN